jgi:S-layer homology domain
MRIKIAIASAVGLVVVTQLALAQTIYRLGVSDFTPIDSATTYSDQFQTDGIPAFSRFSTVPNGTFVATPRLPGGALVTRLEIDYCNTGVPDGVTLTLYQANSDGTSPLIRGQVSMDAGIPCAIQVVDITPFTVDNQNGTLILTATTAAGDANTSISGAALWYELQVSSSTGPQFGDVPASHPLYLWINAFAASGVTAGCGGGNYCPDSAVTRGQLAVFLSKLLGLQFQ